MIKRIFLFALIASVSIINVFGQTENKQLKEQRNAYYNEYKQYKDTMTVRTWINMVNLVERLEKIVNTDNKIISNVTEGDDSEFELSEAEKRLLETRKTLDQLIIQNNKIKDDKDIAQKRLYTSAVIAGISIIILIIFIIMNISLRSRIKSLETDFKFTNDELLKIKDKKTKDENDIRTKIEEVEQEKELIENNLFEVKKAYEALKLDGESNTPDAKEIDRETYKELAEEFNVLKSEVNNIIAEKNLLEESTKEANNKYEKELQKRKQIEL